MLIALDLRNLVGFHNQISIIGRHQTFPRFYSKAIGSKSRGLKSKLAMYYVGKGLYLCLNARGPVTKCSWRFRL
jgi:hypothetical protein